MLKVQLDLVDFKEELVQKEIPVLKVAVELRVELEQLDHKVLKVF